MTVLLLPFQILSLFLLRSGGPGEDLRPLLGTLPSLALTHPFTIQCYLCMLCKNILYHIKDFFSIPSVLRDIFIIKEC